MQWEITGRTTVRPHFLPKVGMDFWLAKVSIFLFVLVVWMLHIGRARHPGPVACRGLEEYLSVGFVNVGGWLTTGDMALNSCAQFLAA